MPSVCLVTVLASWSFLSALAFPQATGSVACNHNLTYAPCQQITFRVMGQEYSTPAECFQGGAHYGATVYRCEGALPGWHCNPKGNQVRVRIYDGGGCPKLPQLDIDLWSWDSWKEVPLELAQALLCVPPKITEDIDPSAKVMECDTGGSSAILQGENLAGNWHLFLSDYDRAQDAAPSSLPGVLREVAMAHSVPPGFRLAAQVQISHFDAASTQASHVDTAQLAGMMASNGHFDLEVSESYVDGEGEPGTLTRRTTFDGELLRNHDTGCDFANAFASTYEFPDVLRMGYCSLVEPLFWWTYDPFTLPLFDGLEVQEMAAAEPGQVLVTRSYPGAHGPFVGERYLVDASGETPHPLSLETLDSTGSVWERWTFANFLSRDGLWRPQEVIHTRFLQGTPEGGRIVTTVHLLAAEVLTQTEADRVPGMWPEDQVWQTWE